MLEFFKRNLGAWLQEYVGINKSLASRTCWKVQEVVETIASRPWWNVASRACVGLFQEGSERSIKRVLTFQEKVQSVA